MSAPLRRSLLYVPCSSEKMLRKAGRRGADVLILDLEDGVHPDQKKAARELLSRLYDEVDFGISEVWIRINPPSQTWGAADLEAVSAARPAGMVLPKAEDPGEVVAIDEKLGGATPLFLMVESAIGVLHAAALARSSPRVTGLLFGAADYRESVRAARHPEELELLFARTQIVLAARAAGIEAFDTPWFEYQDLAGLEASSLRARLLGFDGKTAIHPGQVDPIHHVFSPTSTEVERARRIVAVLEEAMADGRSVAVLEGEMLEALHLKEARRTLERAESAERRRL